MGATYKGNKVYISKDLLAKITDRERKIVLAHEIYHLQHKDNIRMFLAKIFFFSCSEFLNHFLCDMELAADRWSIQKTRDIEAFITLMDKLEHNGLPDYPTKTQRLQLAESMRGKI
jgi:Zn-dependent protease with chaperone function